MFLELDLPMYWKHIRHIQHQKIYLICLHNLDPYPLMNLRESCISLGPPLAFFGLPFELNHFDNWCVISTYKNK